MIQITEKVEEANTLTHGGLFHADEVLATAILELALGDIKLCRVYDVPQEFTGIVYDIGGGIKNGKEFKAELYECAAADEILEMLDADTIREIGEPSTAVSYLPFNTTLVSPPFDKYSN